MTGLKTGGRSALLDVIYGFRRRDLFLCANVIHGNLNSLSVLLRKQLQMFAAHFDFGPNASFYY